MKISAQNEAAGWRSLTDTTEVGLLFRSNACSGRLLVTFDAVSDFTHVQPRVSAEGVARDIAADHAHVATNAANWYQSPETARVVERLAGLRRAYDEVFLYGHSQGGYAALLLSGPLDATNTVAFSPQYSVNPEVVPFENRFRGYTDGLSFVFDDMAATIHPRAPKHVVFDPHQDLDRRHFALIARHPNVVPVRVPFAGHFPGHVMREGGMLRRGVAGLLLRTSTPAAFRADIRAARRRSQRYFAERAVHFSRRGNFREAIRAANVAYALGPENPGVLQTYHAVLTMHADYFGLSHLMLRLLLKERPDWTFHEGALGAIWQEIVRQADGVVNKAPALPSPPTPVMANAS